MSRSDITSALLDWVLLGRLDRAGSARASSRASSPGRKIQENDLSDSKLHFPSHFKFIAGRALDSDEWAVSRVSYDNRSDTEL